MKRTQTIKVMIFAALAITGGVCRAGNGGKVAGALTLGAIVFGDKLVVNSLTCSAAKYASNNPLKTAAVAAGLGLYSSGLLGRAGDVKVELNFDGLLNGLKTAAKIGGVTAGVAGAVTGGIALAKSEFAAKQAKNVVEFVKNNPSVAVRVGAGIVALYLGIPQWIAAKCDTKGTKDEIGYLEECKTFGKKLVVFVKNTQERLKIADSDLAEVKDALKNAEKELAASLKIKKDSNGYGSKIADAISDATNLVLYKNGSARIDGLWVTSMWQKATNAATWSYKKFGEEGKAQLLFSQADDAADLIRAVSTLQDMKVDETSEFTRIAETICNAVENLNTFCDSRITDMGEIPTKVVEKIEVVTVPNIQPNIQ